MLRAKKPWLDPTLAVFERRADRPPKNATPEQAKLFAAGFDKMKQLTRRAAREGARIVMGGHSTVPFAPRGEAPWRELELLVESGFTPLEAITAATSTAAGFLYRNEELGSLRPGFQADLIVVPGDIERNISAIRKIERVMVQGQWVDVGRYRRYVRKEEGRRKTLFFLLFFLLLPFFRTRLLYPSVRRARAQILRRFL